MLFSSRRLKNFIFLLILTGTLAASTLFFSKEFQDQPLYQIIKASVEQETGVTMDSLLENHVLISPTTLPSSTPAASVSSEFAIVKRIVDGDTIEISTGQKVRYIGINTPETHSPQKGKECFGSEASAENRKLVEGKEVRLEKDVSQVDKYGRLLRYVWIDDTLINESLVKTGYAHASTYPPDVKYQEKFKNAEREAREQKLGLWSAC